MEAFLVSTLAVGIAEIGDRSMFLAVLFGIRYQRPWPVFWGMALGLFINQLLSAVLGVWFATLVDAQWLGWIVGGVFLVMAVWVLIPEKEEGEPKIISGRGLFLTAAVAFFMLEMADKTQLAVIALAGVYQSILPVALGASLGILLLTGPALWLGHRFADLLPMRTLNILASVLFFLLAAWMLLGAAGWLPEGILPDLGERFEVLET